MRNIVENKQFDEERALYNLTDAEVINCRFEGPADGESALKEARDIKVKECDFSLRYPLWHVTNFEIDKSSMNETTRAALWYDKNGRITGSKLGGIKALRECEDIVVENSEIVSEAPDEQFIFKFRTSFKDSLCSLVITCNGEEILKNYDITGESPYITQAVLIQEAHYISYIV